MIPHRVTDWVIVMYKYRPSVTVYKRTIEESGSLVLPGTLR